MTLTLSKKVLILLAVPVCFELILVGGALSKLKETQDARQKSMHARILASHLNAIMSLYILRITRLMVRKLTTDDVSSTEEHVLGDKSREHIEKLTQLTNDDPKEHKNWQELIDILKDLDRRSIAVKQTLDSGNKTLAAMQSASVMNEMQRLFRQSQELERDQASNEELFNDQLKRQEDDLRTMLYWSIPASVLTALLLALYFNSSTTRRLQTLSDNALSLFSGKQPKEKLRGEDELKNLDDLFHGMHEELERLRRKERAILDNAGDIICSISKNLKLHEFNYAATKLLGYEREHMQELSVVELIDGDARQKTVDALQNAISRQEPLNFETVMIHANQSKIDTAWSVTWSCDEESLICVVHDITQRKQLEALKRDFVNMLSHDLRTPLSSVLVSIEILSHPKHNLGDEAMRTLEQAEDNLNSSIALISELLEIEKMESGMLELDIDDTNPGKVVLSAIDAVEPLARKNDIVLVPEVATLAPVEADEARLKRVLVNLLGNAIKFSPRAEKIYIRQTLVQKEGGSPAHIRFEVVDRGEGIPIDQQAAVFDRFKQVNPSDDRKRAGSGLGLAICKAIVTAHNGVIGVISRPGQGSTFWFEIPVAQPSKAD